MMPARHGQIRFDGSRFDGSQFDRRWLAELSGDGLAAGSIGPLLAGVRLAAGKSQLRLAELLCAASGVPTVTRHEVSRWEREERIPSAFWLRWLALVLEVPLDALERAAALARARRLMPATRRVTIDHDSAEHDSAEHDSAQDDSAQDDSAQDDGGRSVAVWRHMDDLVGGADLAGPVERELETALRGPRAGSPTRAALGRVAELAQLAGWVLVDAGATQRAARAHVLGLRAATAAGDGALAGLLLTSAAHLGLVGGPPAKALGLAEAGYARAVSSTPAAGRALLLHRVAFAAARAGERRRCERALAAADRAYDRRGDGDGPAWAYWLGDAELTAMSGRCFAVLGRPRIAEPLLTRALTDDAVKGRSAALYTAWLAATLLDAGELERACEAASSALLDSVRLGSVRVLRQVVVLHPRLAAPREAVPAREYRQLAVAIRPYLPDRRPSPPALTGCG